MYWGLLVFWGVSQHRLVAGYQHSGQNISHETSITSYKFTLRNITEESGLQCII